MSQAIGLAGNGNDWLPRPIIGGDDAIAPMSVIVIVAIQVLFFWWLGELFSQSNAPQADQSIQDV